jgi:hypothetical protein
VDRTSHSLDKLPIYARLSIPQVWRYVVGGRPEIFALGETGEGYFPTAESRVLGPLTGDELARFIEAGRTRTHDLGARGATVGA